MLKALQMVCTFQQKMLLKMGLPRVGSLVSYDSNPNGVQLDMR